jgi:hypothetical protein
MTLMVKPDAEWSTTYYRCQVVAPEAFDGDRPLNHWDGRWQRDGLAFPATSPVDCSSITGPPRIDRSTAAAAVRTSYGQHLARRTGPLDQRRARASAKLGCPLSRCMSAEGTHPGDCML